MANNLLTETELSSLPEKQRETYEWMIQRVNSSDGYPNASFYKDALLIETGFFTVILIYPDGTFN